MEGREYDRVAGNGVDCSDTLDGTSSVNSRGGNSTRRHTRELTERQWIVWITVPAAEQWLAADAAIASFSWYFLRRSLRGFAPRR